MPLSGDGQHDAVLLEKAISALVTDTNGRYVDGTFGRGGHSSAILKNIGTNGRLLTFDKDLEAVAVANKLFAEDRRLTMVHGSFTQLQQSAIAMGWVGNTTGVLLDLGVSSPQLDQPERGFSFLREGPLDMRMNLSAGKTAADWVNSASEPEMIWVFKEYGEERFARRIAKAIIAERKKQPLMTTCHLADVVAKAHPAWEKSKHPATRVFQAIRIHINDELQDLAAVLPQILETLAIGGRMVVISFHSLEDRRVKRFMQQHYRGDTFPVGLPVTDDQLNKRLRILGKAIKPSASEIGKNPRARSAVMRVAEKIA